MERYNLIKPTSIKRRKRVGRGAGSGHGKTSTRGQKGQLSRSGSKKRPWFEGGQMPLIRRLPKRGFNNAAFHKHYAIVNLDDIRAFKAGTVVNEQLLRESNLVRGNFVGIKILGDGDLKHGLKVEADKVSAVAREKIEKAGGTITLRNGRAAETRAPHKDVDLTPEGSVAAETTSIVAGKKGSTRKLGAMAKTRKKKTSRKS